MQETMFIDPQRCIGCRSCVAACRECSTHKGYSMIFVDYIDRAESTATMPTVCMHCTEPTCALVCPADAIKQNEDGVVMSALKPRCLDCRNCVNACPFGVPKYNSEMHLQMKCDMCFDRTSEGLKPMCASVCPTGAITFGKYEDVVPLRRTKPVNVHVFGNQKVETKVYVMLPTDADRVSIEATNSFAPRRQKDEGGDHDESWIDTQVEESDKSNEF
jgi:Fe-S-cluster-containing dehydrogenase component